LGTTIGSDNAQGGIDATRHLLGQGRRRIAFIGTASPQYPEFLERWRGYVAALAEAGIAADAGLQADAISTEEAGHDAALRLLATGTAFDAIFAASDLIAIGAMRALAEAGRLVPRAVAVVGFDDLPAASLASPPLTTVMQSPRRAGQVLVETLLQQIAGEDVGNAVLPVQLVVRGSS
jgi:DNA-binding LacI/PurR family transcriptional regulator